MVLAQNWNQSLDVLRIRMRSWSNRKKDRATEFNFFFFNRKFRNISWPSHKPHYSCKCIGSGSKLICGFRTYWSKGGKQPRNSQPVLRYRHSLHSQLRPCGVLHPLGSLTKTTELTDITKASGPGIAQNKQWLPRKTAQIRQREKIAWGNTSMTVPKSFRADSTRLPLSSDFQDDLCAANHMAHRLNSGYEPRIQKWFFIWFEHIHA